MNVYTMNAPVSLNSGTPEDIRSQIKTTTVIADDSSGKGKSSLKEKSSAKEKSGSKEKKKSKTKSTKPSTTKTKDSKTQCSEIIDTPSKSSEKSQSACSDTVPADKPEEDEEVRLAMEMALAAAQNPKLSPAEIRELVGEKNKQSKIVDDFSQKKKQELEKKKMDEIEESQKRWDEKKEIAISWWQTKSMAVKETAVQLTEAAVKRAEEMKNNAAMRMYSEQINKDPEHIELRKKIKAKRKIYKSYRLQGNRTETRHLFQKQRMEKRLIQICDKLNKTQKLFTHSSYNVQEYLKALMRASKKWRKKGSDEELMLEAQLCRNMHQMLALEKQKVKSKKSQREMKKYLQRCKGWLIDKKSFCEMNQMTLEATMQSMKILYEDIIAKQDELIAKLKASDEFKDVDLSDVDISNVKLPVLPGARDAKRSAALFAMKGLPMQDSIKMRKEASVKSGQNNLSGSSNHRTCGPDLYVTARDDVSVCSCLSDPDEPRQIVNQKDKNDGSDNFNFGNDAPWLSSMASLKSTCSASEMKSLANEDSNPLVTSSLPPDIIEEEDDLDSKTKSTRLGSEQKDLYESEFESDSHNAALHISGEDDVPLKATPDTSESVDSVLIIPTTT